MSEEIVDRGSKGYCLLYGFIGIMLFLALVIGIYNYNYNFLG